MPQVAKRRTAGVVVALMTTWAIALVLGAPAAFAHHPEIAGQSVCTDDAPVIEYRSVSWKTDGSPGSGNPLIGIYVNGERVAEGAYTAANGFQFSGSIPATRWAGATVTLTAIAEAAWDNNAPPGDQRSTQVTVGPVKCGTSTTTVAPSTSKVEETTTTGCDSTTVTFGPCETTTTAGATTTTPCGDTTTTTDGCSSTTTQLDSTTTAETTTSKVEQTTTTAEQTTTTGGETTTTAEQTTTSGETTTTGGETTTSAGATTTAPSTTIGEGTTTSAAVTTTVSTPETTDTTTATTGPETTGPTTSLVSSSSTGAQPTTTVSSVPQQTLPFTGFEMQTTAFIGLMTLGAGAVILGSVRRREPLAESDSLGDWSTD